MQKFYQQYDIFRFLFRTFANKEALFEKSNIEKPDEICKLVNRNPTKVKVYRKTLFVNG